MYKGWVSYPHEDETEALQILRDCGVVLGKQNPSLEDGIVTWDDCKVSSEGLDKLDPHFGTLLWGLHDENVTS